MLNCAGKVVAKAIIGTPASSILDFIKSQRGTLHVALRNEPEAASLYHLIRPHVTNVVVCDPRKIAEQGNKADKVHMKS